MFKTRKKVIRKCRSNRQFTDRSNGATRKIEGNSNLTNKRLTIPPGFLCLGITSETTQKEKNLQNSYTQKDFILQEDLHSILNNNVNKDTSIPRRSSRILKQVGRTRNDGDVSASDYYYDILKQPDKTKRQQQNRCNKNGYLKNNSKSLFRQINKQCAKIERQSSMSLSHSEGLLSDKVEVFQPSRFCDNLLKEVRIDLNPDKTLSKLKSAIAEEIDNINQRLSGKLVTSSKMAEDHENRNINMDIDREDIVKNFEYLPKCEWVYETPPRQRIILPKISECAIQPAIICTAKKQSNIYELNPNIEIDLNNYTNRQNIEVDQQYMRHLASFQNNMQIDVGVDRLGNTVSDRRVVNVENNKYNYKRDDHSNAQRYINPFLNPPENNYVPIISRPTKTVSKVARSGNMFKRKIQELEGTPIARNSLRTDAHFEGDITFINDEGEFKMVNTQSLADGRNLNFQFKKNLFKTCGEDSLFNFSKEEPKVFDFSQLRKDDC